MENQERYYNIKKLNLLFALVSILLLSALVFLFISDYSREWKLYQKDFRALEIAKTKAKYAEEVEKLKGKSDYQDLLAKLEAAQKNYFAKAAELTALNKESYKLNAKNDLNQQKYQFAKAQRDAAKYEYEKSLAENPKDAPEKERKYNQINQTAEALRLQSEKSATAVSLQSAKIQDLGAALKQLEKDKLAASRQSDLLLRKLQKIDPKEMTFANRLAESVRNLPVLDLMNPSYRIEQVVIKDITDDVNFMRVPKVDRCTTCHTGVLKPGFEDAPQPFRTHPNLELFLSSNSAHPFDEFGCTSCHGGRGRGTSFFSAAHMPSSEEQRAQWQQKYGWKPFDFWETPMLPKKYVEAGCFKCHSEEATIKSAPKLNLGLNLIEKAACFGCHNLDRYKDWPKVGPDLTKLLVKTDKEWVYRWIKDPKSFRHNTWMPSFFGLTNTSDEASVKRADQEIHAIVQYLFNHSSDFKEAEPPGAGDVKKGEQLVASIGCFGCHEMKPSPSGEKVTQETLRRQHGPNLIGLRSKTTKKWLYNWLKNPSRYHPETRMPNLRLSDEEANDIAAYLSVPENSDFMKKQVASVDEAMLNQIVMDFLMKMTTADDAQKQLDAMSPDNKLEFAGKKLIKHYGCFACHNIEGFENEKPIGTDLTEEGSKSAHRLDFGFVHLEHTNHAWFEQKLKDPRIFDKDRVRAADEKLKMPNFHFSDEEAEAITTALLGFVKDKPAVSKMPKINPHVESGRKLVREFNCQGCHIMEGEGGTIRSTVTEWLEKYDGKTDAEAKAMAASFSPPNLIGEGEKVHPQWLFDFIHSPEVIRPWLKVRMPTFMLSDANINTLVRYFNDLDHQDFPFETQSRQTPSPEMVDAGKMLFAKDYLNCATCHIVGSKMPSGSPDSWAPNFALSKSRLKPEWIIKWLKNPQAALPGTKMPTFFDPAYFDASGPDNILNGDENKQIEALRDYLLTVTEDAPASPEMPSPPQAQPVLEPAVSEVPAPAAVSKQPPATEK